MAPISYLKKGQKVTFTSLSKPDESLEGVIREISPIVERETRLAMARVDVPFNHEVWKPGMFVSGKVKLSIKPSLTVPTKSVIDRDGRKIVFVLDKEKVFARTVKTGESANNLTQILDGLKEGEMIVTSGAGFLKDGDIVRVGQDSK